jgi:hypothetical protein
MPIRTKAEFLAELRRKTISLDEFNGTFTPPQPIRTIAPGEPCPIYGSCGNEDCDGRYRAECEGMLGIVSGFLTRQRGSGYQIE